VIDANYRFSRKRYSQEFHWTPSAEVMKEIEEKIFGKKTTPLKLV
jgi:hypothetical protein